MVIAVLAGSLNFKAYAQVGGFVQEDGIRIPGITAVNQIGGLNTTQKQTTRTFFDGLGRVSQTIGLQTSPLQRDIIQPIVYDNLGRPIKTYLAYAGSSSDVSGSYRTNAVSAQAAYFNNGTTDKVADDTSPFSQQVFENSPLQRLLNSGMVGTGFQAGVSGDHYKSVNYRSNTSADGNIIMWGPDGSNLGYYSINALAVTYSTDEDGGPVVIFADDLGRTVLKRQIFSATVNYDTYYVYNNAGQISYIIPPKATQLIVANSYTLAQAGVSSLLFQYQYDNQGRVVKKVIPSKGTLTIVYDPLSRPVLTQDNNLALLHQWNYIKYDAKGRMISQGIYTDTNHDNTNIQAYVNGLAGYNTAWFETRSNTAATGYYTNSIFPTTGTSALTPLAYSYFDDYDLNYDNSHIPDYSYTPQLLTGEGSQTTAPVKGLPTMVRTHSVGAGLNVWLLKVMFYDKDGNVIQTMSNNQLNYTVDVLTDNQTTVRDFVGIPKQSKTVKVTGIGAANTQTVLTSFYYDHMYRITAVDQNYNNTGIVHIANYSYNELGQIIDKKLGSTNGTTWLQSVDFRYNIRNQLTSINNSKLSNDGVLNDDTNDLFGMQLYYNTGDINLNDWFYYNGRLNSVKWMSKNAAGVSSNERAFTYIYDAVGRYTAAGYEERAAAATGAFTITHGWDETVTGYDANGNITGLQRNATTQGSGSFTAVDNLNYTYGSTNANQLVNITDGTGINFTGTGFRNYTGSTGNYTYDANGNIASDPYKGLTFGTYNVLNKVDKITFTYNATGRYIDYTYDSEGHLIRKRQYDNNVLTNTTDYIDGFVYVNSTISYFAIPEGRAMNISGVIKPEYIINDQQGNARVSFMNNGSGIAVIKQENSYYGFGMVMPGTTVTGDDNKKLYNGGSDWQKDYDILPDYFQTFYRNYDAAIGRWVGTDPMADEAESLSVYNYSDDNPIMYNDPLGDLTGGGPSDYAIPRQHSANAVDDFNERMQITQEAMSITAQIQNQGGGGNPGLFVSVYNQIATAHGLNGTSGMNYGSYNGQYSIHFQTLVPYGDPESTSGVGFRVASHTIRGNSDQWRDPLGLYPTTSGGGAPWVNFAKTQLGVTEATHKNDGPDVDKYLATAGLKGTGLPWCGCFVNWSMRSAGIKGVKDPAAALNWRNFGQKLNVPAFGSLGTLQRPGGGHVGFVVGRDGSHSGWVIMLGGNQSDAVSYRSFPVSIMQFNYPAGFVPSYSLPVMYGIPKGVKMQ